MQTMGRSILSTTTAKASITRPGSKRRPVVCLAPSIGRLRGKVHDATANSCTWGNAPPRG